YQEDFFYRVFPRTVHSGKRQSQTLRWIYTHTQDGKGVVTPRDVIDLLTRAKQRQQDELRNSQNSPLDWIIGPQAIRYGLTELSKRKRDTYLKAEFPHFWPHIEKFIAGKTQYSEKASGKLLGSKWAEVVSDLVSIGLLTETKTQGKRMLKIPFIF